MTAYNTIEKMVRNSHHELKQLGSFDSIISDLDKLAEIENGDERSEKRELVFSKVIDYLVNNNIISQHDAFNLMNLTDEEYGEKSIFDNNHNSGGAISKNNSIGLLDGYDDNDSDDLSLDYDEWCKQ